MNTALGTLLCVALLVAGSESEFSFNQVADYYLSFNKCASPDFDASYELIAVSECLSEFSINHLSDLCNGDSKLPLLINCIAFKRGILTYDDATGATSFSVEAFKSRLQELTSNQTWVDYYHRVIDHCTSDPATELKQSQLAVQALACFKFVLALDCELTEDSGFLSAVGALHRVMFFNQDCSLRLMEAVEAITSHTFEECSVGRYQGSEPLMAYDAKIHTLICLTRDFLNADGTIDSPSMLTAIQEQGANFSGLDQLEEPVKACENISDPMLFFQCCTEYSMRHCVIELTYDIGAQLPSTCTELFTIF